MGGRIDDRFFAEIVDASPHALAVLDSQGRVLFANEGGRALLGSSPDDAATLDALSRAPRAGATEIRRFAGQQIRLARLSQGTLVTAEASADGAGPTAPAVEQGRADPLTGLADQSMFRARLAAFLDVAPRPLKAAALLVDLDRFKAVNETLGHAIGDALLQVVSERLRSTLREADVLARLGGDEFAILQVDADRPQAAAALAARIVDLLGRAYLIDGHLINIGASVGVTLLGEGATYEEVLRNADLALDRAKRSAPGGIRFFEPAMDEEMRSRRELELDLRRALALREFSLAYQPQFNIGAGKVTGFEALLRWNSPTRGQVSPLDFIPIAEQIGLIAPIGEWVIRTACREAAGWPGELRVAVNISAVQFRSRNLLPTIVSALAESGLDPRRLEVEITESVLLEDSRGALDLLNGVREMGVSVSMDDFGTGYSSLSYLRSFPFDKIKIDQSFVRGESFDDPGAAAIVGAIAALGRSLGMTTTAEGVETSEQYRRIADFGCTDVQGYLISRPMPPEQIAGFLAARQAESGSHQRSSR